jgi:PAS domain S-box-containing protein
MTPHEPLSSRDEPKLDALFRNMTEGFAYHRIIEDSDGHPCDYVFLEVNPAFERLTGLSQEAVVGQRVTRVIPGIERDPARFIEQYGRVAKTGKPVSFETYTEALERWFSISAFCPEPGFFAVVFSDITSRKRIEAELRQRQRQSRLLSETAGQLLASQDPQSLVNELCSRIMDHLECDVFVNYLADEPAGKLHLNACAGLPGEQVQELAELDFGVAICGAVACNRERILAEDVQSSADTRTALIRSLGLRAYACHPLIAQGKLIGTLSFGTRTRTKFSPDDVSLMQTVADQVSLAMQRVQAKAELEAANARLVESDQRKNEFLAVLSHELRNPLAPIMHSLYLLDHVEPSSPRAERAMGVLKRQVEQLTRLVNDLLDVTRVSRNKIDLQLEWLDLGALVQHAVEDQRPLFERQGITLTLALPTAPLFVRADPTRSAQVVSNLLQNAAKFAGRDGVTEVSLAPDRARGYAELRVTDKGLGMTAETLAGLFQPFMQADKTLDRRQGGLGLGLSLVKGLVELHGGSITARSAGLGRGSEFVVRLPIGEPPTHPASDASATATPREHRVLVIEDNVDAAESLRSALELGGHHVTTAKDGLEGLSAARMVRPDIVLCDIGLPGIDGYEIARAFHADAELRSIPIVALSGYAQPDDLRRAADAGFSHHLAKPADIERIEALLAALPTRAPGAS